MKRKFNRRRSNYKENWKNNSEIKDRVEAPSSENQINFFNRMSFKQLQNNPIETKADPSASNSKTAMVYPLFNRLNPIIGVNYPGIPTISGNSVIIMSNSNDSKLKYSWDSACYRFDVNYLMLQLQQNKMNNKSPFNWKALDEMAKTIETALSIGSATMLTQLPFFTDDYEPGPNVQHIKDKALFLNNGVLKSSVTKLLALLHYQTVMQSIVGIITKANQTLAIEPLLKQMSFRREENLITQIYNLLKKKTFSGNINSVATSIMSEYFDVNWFEQTSTLVNINTRKSDAMDSPLLSTIVTQFIPDIKFKTGNVVTYDSTNVLVENGKFINPETFKFEDFTSNSITLNELITRFHKMMDQYYILKWCRMKNNLKLIDPQAVSTPAGYVESINRLASAIGLIAARFSSNMNSIRTFLDKLSDTNIIYWTKNNKFEADFVNNDSPSLKYNSLIFDILKSDYCSPSKIGFDSATQRWKYLSIWDKYTGMPAFDLVSGGAFLSLSTRELDSTYIDQNGDPTTLSDEDPRKLFPLLINQENESEFRIQNIIADEVKAVKTTVDYEETKLISEISLFNPVDFTSFRPTFPKFQTDDKLNSENDAFVFSDKSGYLRKAVLTIFPWAIVAACNNSKTYKKGEQVQLRYRYEANDSIIAAFDLQLDDLVNPTITYIRNYSPFKVSTPSGERTFGFKSV